MADTAPAPAPAAEQSSRPTKPDEDAYKAELAILEKAHKENMDKFNSVKTKADAARPGKDSPANDRRNTLIQEQREIREKQGAFKNARASHQEQVKKADEDLKRLMEKQKAERSRVGYKNADEVDFKIKDLESQVDSGSMKIVDEKKALAEIQTLKKQRKGFSGLDDAQKAIDAKKADLSELKKSGDNPEFKALSQKYEDNQKELDDIKATREDSSKSFNAIRDERTRLYEAQQASFQAIRKHKDDNYNQRKAYKVYEDQLYQAKREKKQAEYQAFQKMKRTEAAKQRLEEASAPAFGDEIAAAEGLIRHFDPSGLPMETSKGRDGMAKEAGRVIEETPMKGMKVMKKEEEDFFVGGAGKKKGKGKKNAAGGSKFNLDPGMLSQFDKCGVEPPMSQADVPTSVEKLQEKLNGWKKDQKSQTEAVSGENGFIRKVT